MLKAISAIAASLLIIGGLITVFSSESVSRSAPDGVATDLGWTPHCSTAADMTIKAVDSGYYLKPGTVSGGTVSFTNPDANTIRTWSVVQTGSNAISGQARRDSSGEWYIKTSSQMYLQRDGSKLRVSSTANPSSDMKFVLESDHSTGECNRFFIRASGSNKYLQSGVFSARLDTHKDAFLVQTESNTNSQWPPCGVVNTYSCTSELKCQTGVLVAWTNSARTHSDSTRESIEHAAQSSCNSHCLTCPSWSLNCKSCGGQIDKYTTHESQNGNLYAQCDCSGAFKAVQLSFGSVLVLMMMAANMLK